MKILKITYFVHGTTTDNENHIATGWAQGELSELGIQQSKDLKLQISGKKFDVIFCSDLKRAIDSANLTFGDIGIPIIQDKRLRECNYGDFQQKGSKVVGSMTVERIEYPFQNGESYKNVEKRVRSFLEEMVEKYDGKHIAIVSHKAPQLALDVITKGKPWKQVIEEDWRHTKSWKPGWEYNFIKE